MKYPFHANIALPQSIIALLFLSDEEFPIYFKLKAFVVTYGSKHFAYFI